MGGIHPFSLPISFLYLFVNMKMGGTNIEIRAGHSSIFILNQLWELCQTHPNIYSAPPPITSNNPLKYVLPCTSDEMSFLHGNITCLMAKCLIKNQELWITWLSSTTTYFFSEAGIIDLLRQF